jgi:hypothetical protein
MSSKFSDVVRKLPSFDTDEELNKYDVELGLEELRRQLKIIESDKRKETYDLKKEAFNLRQAIRQVEKGKDMPYDEFMAILRENSIPIPRGSYFVREIDPESGKEITVEIQYDNRFPPVPSPKTGLRRRTPESRSSSPFISISSFDIKPSSRPTTPLLPTTSEEVVRKKSVCPPEGCEIMGGVRRRQRKTRKIRKVRKSRKSKKTNKKSKRKI